MQDPEFKKEYENKELLLNQLFVQLIQQFICLLNGFSLIDTENDNRIPFVLRVQNAFPGNRKGALGFFQGKIQCETQGEHFIPSGLFCTV